jgi:Cysteine-rich CPCC
MPADRFTCPCCGFRTFAEPPGSYGICHICFWEDDPVQLLDPWAAGGANRPNLVNAQATYALCGAVEERFLSHVKERLATDERDAEWRPVADYDRVFSRKLGDLTDAEHRELTSWYYWRRRIA